MNKIKITADSDHVENNDFTVSNFENKKSIWLTVNKFAIHIKQNDIGISIDVYGVDAVLEHEVASLTAWDEDIPTEADNE